MHLRNLNEALDHRIVSGADYQWSCYGVARILDYESDSGNASTIYNPKTGEIYEVTVEDKQTPIPYRWLNPRSKPLLAEETTRRGFDIAIAWDDIAWNDINDSIAFLDIAARILGTRPVIMAAPVLTENNIKRRDYDCNGI